jgi:hypothetical protein
VDDHTGESHSRPVSWAVFLGNVLLIGLPTLVVCYGAFRGVLGPYGPELWGGTVGELVALALAFVLARWTVLEVTAIRLHGAEALLRGSRRATFARVGLVGAWTLALVVLLGYGLLQTSVGLWETGRLGVMALAALLALSVVGAAGYAVHEFYDGVRAGRA